MARGIFYFKIMKQLGLILIMISLSQLSIKYHKFYYNNLTPSISSPPGQELVSVDKLTSGLSHIRILDVNDFYEWKYYIKQTTFPGIIYVEYLVSFYCSLVFREPIIVDYYPVLPEGRIEYPDIEQLTKLQDGEEVYVIGSKCRMQYICNNQYPWFYGLIRRYVMIKTTFIRDNDDLVIKNPMRFDTELPIPFGPWTKQFIILQ